MSNTQAPYGFRATRRIDGAAPNYAMMPSRLIATGYSSSAIGQGDVVTSLSTGYIAIASSTANVAQGVFQGCQYYDTNNQAWQFRNYLPTTQASNADIQAFTVSDVKQVFEAQSNGAAITTPQINLNCTWVTASNGAPNTYSGISTAAIDPASVSTTNTLQFRIVGLGQSVGNDNTSSFNTVEVILNAADYNSTTGV